MLLYIYIYNEKRTANVATSCKRQGHKLLELETTLLIDVQIKPIQTHIQSPFVHPRTYSSIKGSNIHLRVFIHQRRGGGFRRRAGWGRGGAELDHGLRQI